MVIEDRSGAKGSQGTVKRTAPPERELLRWMQSTLEQRGDARLQGMELAMMASGPGARNHVFSACSGRRRYVIKVRRDAADTAEREAWALRRLRGTVAPRLVDWWPSDLVRDPRFRSGGCVVMARAAGESPDVRQLALAARTIARLHSDVPRRGLELSCPSSFGALLRYAADLAERLGRRRHTPTLQSAALMRALRAQAERSVPSFPRVRVLCHGDLEWHNMRFQDQRFKLLDFEVAGIGDPAVDLMLMKARAPLSDEEAEQLLSSYLEHRRDETLRARCALLGPLVGLVSALSAALVSSAGAREELARALARRDYS